MRKRLFTLGALTLMLFMIASIAAAENPTVTIETTKGTIEVELFADKVPVTVANFVNLANRGYYNGIKFHRVIENFMIQTGDPEGTGRGGPGYTFPDEFHPALRHDGAGVLSMANRGPNTNGSQFFITHKETPWLDNKHTVFGKVTRGKEILDSIAKGDSMDKVTIKGDTAAAMKSAEKHLLSWNEMLDKSFPKKN